MSQIAFALSFLLCIHISCLAQETKPNRLLDSLKQQSHIPWIGTISIDYAPYYHSLQAPKTMQTYMTQLGIKGSYTTLKDNISTKQTPNPFIQALLENAYQLVTYKTAALQQRHSEQSIKNILYPRDTFVYIDGVTEIASSEITSEKIYFEEVKTVRVELLIYYDAQQLMFKAIPLAFAPTLFVYDLSANLKGRKPLFWLQPNHQKPPSLDIPAIPWAKRLSQDIRLDSIQVIKQKDSLPRLLEKMLAALRTDSTQIKLHHSWGTPMNQEEKRQLGIAIDTIRGTSPDVLSPKVKTHQTQLQGEEVISLRFMQDWIWDEKKRQVYIRLAAFGPIIKHYDKDGNFLTDAPLFIRKIADNND